MKTFVKRGDTVEAMQYFGMKAPTWPAFCAWCLDHDLDIKIEKDYHEDYASEPERKARIRYTDLIVGQWIVVDPDRYIKFEVFTAAEFVEKYVAVSEVAEPVHHGDASGFVVGDRVNVVTVLGTKWSGNPFTAIVRHIYGNDDLRVIDIEHSEWSVHASDLELIEAAEKVDA